MMHSLQETFGPSRCGPGLRFHLGCTCDFYSCDLDGNGRPELVVTFRVTGWELDSTEDLQPTSSSWRVDPISVGKKLSGDGFAVLTEVDGHLLPIFYVYHDYYAITPCFGVVPGDSLPKLIWNDLDRGGSKMQYVWGWEKDEERGDHWSAWARKWDDATGKWLLPRIETNFVSVWQGK